MIAICLSVYVCRSIHPTVGIRMLPSLSHVRHHRLPLVLFWGSARGKLDGLTSDVVPRGVFLLTTDAIRENPDDVAAILPIIPSLPPAVQAAFENALKNAISPQNEETFAKLHKAIIKVGRPFSIVSLSFLPSHHAHLRVCICVCSTGVGPPAAFGGRNRGPASRECPAQ